MARSIDVEAKPDLRSQFPITDSIFTIPEAGKILCHSRSKLYELIAVGKLKTVCVGRRRLVPGAEIQRLVRELTARAA